VKRVKIRIGIFNVEYRLLAEVDTDQEGLMVVNEDGNLQFEVDIRPLHLRYGKYSIHLHVMDQDTQERLLRQSDIAHFLVKNTIPVGADFILPATWRFQTT
jgi:hypothetical protein